METVIITAIVAAFLGIWIAKKWNEWNDLQQYFFVAIVFFTLFGAGAALLITYYL